MSLDDSDAVPLEEHDDYKLLCSVVGNFRMYSGVDLDNDLKLLRVFIERIQSGFELEDSDREKIFEIEERLCDLYSNVGRGLGDLFEISDRLGR